MKILFAIKSLNVKGGGAEKVLVEVVNGLQIRGYEVSVLTFDFPGESFYGLLPEIKRYDMAFNQAGLSMPRLAMLRALPRMRAAISCVRPDVVIPFMHSTFIALAPALIWRPHVNVIFSEHTDYSHYKIRTFQYRILRIAQRLASVTTIPSETALLSYPIKNNYEVIHNPIDSEYFGSLGSREMDTPKVLVAVGRFFPEKDHSILIDAFADLVDAFPDWRLRIVGDGPLRGDLEAQVERLGLGTRVEMPGFARDVGIIYANARFVVLPSRYESFGMVAAEALAANRAVLSFDDCAGVTEIVENEVNGLLVAGSADRSARVANLVYGLRRMMEDPELCRRMGCAGPDAIAQFGLEAVLDRWEEVIGLATDRTQ